VPQEIGPEFRLDEQIEAGLQSFNEAGHDPGKIKRRITVICHACQPLFYSFPSGLGHRRDYQPALGMTAMEIHDEWCHRHHFTKRDGMNPNNWLVRSV
jgi:hypothetical protein